MIARRFVPALVLTLPLLAGAQAPRARSAPTERAENDAPYVRVWLPGTWEFRYGEPVQVSFEVSEASHVAVFRVDGEGRLTVLWPQRNSLQTAARAGQEYRVTAPYSSIAAFRADYSFAGGMVIAVASYDPIDLTAFRRYRNDVSYYRNVLYQRPYVGGVRHIVDRISQEILYSPESEFDYDVAFYNVSGRGSFTSASCNDLLFARRHAVSRSYISWVTGSPNGYWDDCYSGFYSLYLLSCSSWTALYSGYVHCRNYWDRNWPVPPVSGQPQPEPPKVNITMIDSIIGRPVERYPLLDRKPEPTTPNGTTKVVTMEPVRDAPNVTRWVSDNENDAISIPHLRGNTDLRDQSRIGKANTRDEGFVRSPGTGIRFDEPRPGDAPDRNGGMITMPPVREPPRPEPVWRGTDGGTTMTPRWDRPTTSTTIDRGTTTTGTPPSSGVSSSPPPPPAPPPTPPAKATESKPPAESKPPVKPPV